MKRSSFDEFASEYETLHASSIALSGEPPEFFARYKVEDVRDRLQKVASLGAINRILDVGCGLGASIAHFRKAFPNAVTVGVDASGRSLAVAAQRNADTPFAQCDALRLPFPEGLFDCAFAAGVIHHVPLEQRMAAMVEMRRVLRPRGLIALFEHNPLNPLTRTAVRLCPFDADAQLIRAGTLARLLRQVGFANVAISYRIFFPHALNRLRPFERRLSWLPLGAQYSAFASK